MTTSRPSPTPGAADNKSDLRDSDLGRLEQALSRVVTWSTRNDVQTETMRRARCELPRGHLWLLSRLDRCGTARLSDLAVSLGVDKSTLAPQAKRLLLDGLITRAADPNDRRAAQLRITRRGRIVLTRLHTTRRTMLSELLTDWSPADQTRIADLLTEFADTLDRATANARGASG